MAEGDPITGGGNGGNGGESRRSLVCEFCESKLTSTGDGLKKSDRYRALLKAEEDLALAKAEIATLKTKIETQAAEITRLSAPPAPRTDSPRPHLSL